ncbi:MAG TPA: DUF5682 family protein [Fimbriimonadaceae bacterium]|nr:DUF5682 family protein [Fimbriimonadaceae bacterium]
MAETRIFGIRHHGPGSARSLVRGLRAFQPDVLLIEAPAEVEGLFQAVAHAEMRPPVAILAYAADDPKRAAFYPFAEFSPEWNAIRYGLDKEIPIRAMDLPAAYSLGVEEEDREERPDPLAAIARVAGYEDGEVWWEHTFEQRWSPEDPFAVVADLMAALRADEPVPELDLRREAFMRLAIRKAKEEFGRIAVVCGAFHVPALLTDGKAGADRALLKDQPKLKIAATWVPWTYQRLAFASGYGAGVISPAYYEHLWKSEPDMVAHGWLLRAARLLREEGLSASTASVIESVRLAESLACVRGRPVPGLHELIDAVCAVLTGGDPTPLRLIDERLIIGVKLGEIPADTPAIPIQADLAAQQKRLRLKPEALQRKLDLDLRTENDLARSHLLHRLNLLGVDWGHYQDARGKLGTFHELWDLQWRPELSIAVIVASRWGASVEAAANVRATELATEATQLDRLTELARAVLTAGLAEALGPVLDRIEDAAAVSTSANDLLDSLPPLGWIVRYGDVRRTDTSLVAQVFDSILTRGCIALPAACVSLDDEAAAAMAGRFDATQGVVSLLDSDEHRTIWADALRQVAGLSGAHGLAIGRATRLLFDMGRLSAEEVALALSRAASPGAVPLETAAWIEGLLGKSGALLLHEDRLWSILDAWVRGLSADSFVETLPLLRRTFSVFARPERRQLAEKAQGNRRSDEATHDIDEERAMRPMPLLRLILGLEEPS